MTDTEKAFIEEVGALAAEDMKKSGVLASLTIAQAIIESAWGLSGLAVRANALFGIKAGTAWKGRVYSANTKECYDGLTFETVNAAFRAYGGWAESIADHSALLTGLARYAAVVGERDYKTACRAIQAAGYATDPAYADKLIQVIEKYGLTVYDGGADLKGDVQTMTEQEKRNRETIVQTAQGFLGRKESDGSHMEILNIYNAHKPLARNYKMTAKDPWCATFVSAVAIKAEATSIIPLECSCAAMIRLFQSMGRWQENDAYVPAPGDILFYDWQDDKKTFRTTDNKGAPDHVGIVTACDGKNIRVIEGNYKDAVGYRNVEVNGLYIRGYGLPDYAGMVSSTSNITAAGSTQGLAVGSIVMFTGGTHYASADAANGASCKPGQVKITMLATGQKHPYHVQAITGGGSTAHGWVNAADIQTAPKMRVGATVDYSGPVYRDSTGSGKGNTVNGSFTVTYYRSSAKCGVHIGEIGWVPESNCKVTG